MSLLKEKFNWVKGVLVEWNLNQQEQVCLLGEGTACAIGIIDPESEAAKLLEEKFDTIKNIIDSLDNAASQKNDELYGVRWLRTRKSANKYGGKSPLAYIRDGGIDAAKEVALDFSPPT